jgi:hypothetical protein
MDLFCNRSYVKTVSRSKEGMRLKSNGGTMLVTEKALSRVRGYPSQVWFDDNATTNILALKNVKKHFHVTYDSNDDMFVVHRESANLPNMKFLMHESGLHYYDPSQHKTSSSARDGSIISTYRKNSESSDFLFVETVSGNKVSFTKRAIKGAEAARTLYSTLSYPSWPDFKWVIRSNQIKDCPVTIEDANNAYQIWGTNIAALKGKTTRRKPAPVAPSYVKIPKEFLNLHGDVFLTLDIFFVNKLPFLLTLSRKICYTTVQHLGGQTVSEIFKSFKAVYQHYIRRGFRITTVHADGEFAPLKSLIVSMPSGPAVNLASSNEHVSEIERRIRVVKERCRATRHNLPFTRIPKLLTIHVVTNAVMLLNSFPTKGGVSDTLSLKTILTGESLDYKKHLRLQIGQYCQVH